MSQSFPCQLLVRWNGSKPLYDGAHDCHAFLFKTQTELDAFRCGFAWAADFGGAEVVTDDPEAHVVISVAPIG